jgi:hypothetical protein
MKRGFTLFVIVIVVVFAAVFIFTYMQKKPELAPSADTEVSVEVGNVAPVIENVAAIPAVTLLPAASTDVTFTFDASDPNGVADLDDATATADFDRGVEPTRSDGDGCAFVSELLGVRTYTCTVPMQYFDEAGLWTVTVGISDIAGPLTTTDATTTVTVNLLRDISIAPATVSFPTVIQGGVDIAASTDTTVTNNGNFVVPTDGTFDVTGSLLAGETTPADTIPTANFNAAGSSEIDPCATGTALVDSVATSIGTAALARGAIGNTEDIGYCLTSVPGAISSQVYSTVAGGTPWTLAI